MHFIRNLVIIVAILSIPKFVNAIEGGAMAHGSNWDYSVKITSDEGLCSGTQISETIIITAAHCLKSVGARYKITSGDYQSRYANVAYIDPEYSEVFNQGDIALLETESDVEWPHYPGSLMTSEEYLAVLGGAKPNSQLLILGFGDQGDGRSGERKIMYSNGFDLGFLMNAGFFLQEDHPSTGATRPGDSGGGVEMIFNGRRLLGAVTSYGAQLNFDKGDLFLDPRIPAEYGEFISGYAPIVPSLCRTSVALQNAISFDSSYCSKVIEVIEVLRNNSLSRNRDPYQLLYLYNIIDETKISKTISGELIQHTILYAAAINGAELDVLLPKIARSVDSLPRSFLTQEQEQEREKLIAQIAMIMDRRGLLPKDIDKMRSGEVARYAFKLYLREIRSSTKAWTTDEALDALEAYDLLRESKRCSFQQCPEAIIVRFVFGRDRLQYGSSISNESVSWDDFTHPTTRDAITFHIEALREIGAFCILSFNMTDIDLIFERVLEIGVPEEWISYFDITKDDGSKSVGFNVKRPNKWDLRFAISVESNRRSLSVGPVESLVDFEKWLTGQGFQGPNADLIGDTWKRPAPFVFRTGKRNEIRIVRDESDRPHIIISVDRVGTASEAAEDDDIWAKYASCNA